MPTSFRDRLRWFHEVPRWYLLALLVWGPWCYGSTRPWFADLFGVLMAILGGLWLISILIRGQLPRVPALLVACLAPLLLQGWWMIANADHHYNQYDFRFEPITPLVAWLPAAADTAQAIPMMIRGTGIFAVILFVADLMQRPIWRTRLWITIGLTGFSIAVFGITRKILGINLQSAYSFALSGETSFATYFYHGNAGAYINLVLPFIWGLAALSWRRWDANLQKMIWIPALLICIGSAVVIASKAAMVLSLVLLGILVLAEFRFLSRREDLIQRKTMLIYGSLGLLALVVAIAFGWHSAARRWAEVAGAPGLAQERLVVYRVCLKMLPDSGTWGFGPANFNIAFPHYTNDLGDKIKGFWMFAHEDYLQTAIEWGWFGAFFWSALLIGALISGALTLRRSSLSKSDQMFVFAGLLALAGVAAHAAVDFPLQIASLQLYAGVATGVLWGSRNITDTIRSSRRSSTASKSK